MTKIRRLMVLEGGKDLNKNKYGFYKAMATKTRLMGVVALKLHWISAGGIHFIQWFLLDAEEHGIYDYISDKTHKEETDRYTGQFMGSLGGEKVEISRREAYFLIQTFGIQNRIYKKPLPRPEGYRFILNSPVKLKPNEITALNQKIFEKVLYPSQAINFFIMRAVAKDQGGMAYLLNQPFGKKLSEYSLTKRAGVLLKNKINPTPDDSTYIAESIVEEKEQQYNLIRWRVTITRIKGIYKIKDSKILSKQPITPDEVALEIQNSEYIKLYKLKIAKDGLLKYFNETKGDFLKYEFQQGVMYVEFRKNNRHVMGNLYHIGGDIKAIYFINNLQQLISCYYHKEDGADIEDFLQEPLKKKALEPMDELHRRGSIIYEYAESDEVDFLNYLKDLR